MVGERLVRHRLSMNVVATQGLHRNAMLFGGATRLKRVGAYVVVIIVVGQIAPRFGIC